MYLDTAAAMTAQSPLYRDRPTPPRRRDRRDLLRWQDRIVFGSDFPNTPHPYDDERRRSGSAGAGHGPPQDLPRQRQRLLVSSARRAGPVPGGGAARARRARAAGRPRGRLGGGGTLRELLSGGAAAIWTSRDEGALELGRRLAERLDASFVVLDEDRGAARIGRGRRRGGDLVDFRAPTIEDDLRARDFTVNALAAPVADLLRDGAARS